MMTKQDSVPCLSIDFKPTGVARTLVSPGRYSTLQRVRGRYVATDPSCFCRHLRLHRSFSSPSHSQQPGRLHLHARTRRKVHWRSSRGILGTTIVPSSVGATAVEVNLTQGRSGGVVGRHG
uniref:Uncharacterized protein n=1 Tax=Haemonchus contortus TaxID=6289 RepID=A0A7I4YJQ5_HAECO